MENESTKMYSLPLLIHMVFQQQMAFPKGWQACQKFHTKPVWNQIVIKSLTWNRRNGLWNLESILTANVLPEPVCAIPTISRPLIAMGHPCAWIEVGSLNPNFLKMYKKLHITYSRDKNILLHALSLRFYHDTMWPRKTVLLQNALRVHKFFFHWVAPSGDSSHTHSSLKYS